MPIKITRRQKDRQTVSERYTKKMSFFKTISLHLTDRRFNAFVIFVVSILFLILSQSTRWADAEFWSVSFSKAFMWAPKDPSSNYKLFFHFLIKPIYLFEFSNIKTMLAARWLFALNGMAIAFLTYQLGYTQFRNSKTALWAVLLLISTSFFLGQGFQIRPDLLATTLQLLTVWVFLLFYKVARPYSWIQMLIISLLHVLMLLTTPKSIYLVLINYIFFASYYFYALRPVHLAKFLTTSLMVLCSVGFLVVLAKFTQIRSAFEVFLYSFSDDAIKPIFLTAKSFYYVGRFFKENLIHAFLIASGIIYLFKRWPHLLPLKKPYIWSALAGVIVILFNKDRQPYFILSFLPLICIVLSFYIEKALRLYAYGLRILITIVFLIAAVYHAQNIFELNNNFEQRHAIVTMENYLQLYPEAKFYTATAVLPHDEKIIWNIDPVNQRIDKNPVGIILQQENPDLVFFNNRMFAYEQEVMTYLNQNNYILIGGGLYAKTTTCQATAGSGKVKYFYTGKDFLNMKITESTETTDANAPYNQSVCSEFKPFNFENEKTFAEIFDN